MGESLSGQQYSLSISLIFRLFFLVENVFVVVAFFLRLHKININKMNCSNSRTVFISALITMHISLHFFLARASTVICTRI